MNKRDIILFHQRRPRVQCWGCGGGHMLSNFFPQKGNASQVHNIQEAKTVGQVARTIPRIYTTLEDLQGYH